MDTTGKASGRKVKRRRGALKALARRPARRRPARKLTVAQLIQRLHHIVCPRPDTQSTKQQVLHQAKTYIQDLEKTLDLLLKMKGQFWANQGDSCSLDDVKEEYMQACSSHDQGGALASSSMASESDPVFSYLQPKFEVEVGDAMEDLHINSPLSPENITAPDLIEFERYLHFYKQTVDTLTESRTVSVDQITQPSVSKAIANIWQDLKQEGNLSVYQYGIPQGQSSPCSFTFQSDLSCTNGGARDNSAGSQEATSSFLSSTPEEILIEDAFDAAASFLDQSANQTIFSPRCSSYESPPLETQEGGVYLYQQVYDFLRSMFCPYPQYHGLSCDTAADCPSYDPLLDNESTNENASSSFGDLLFQPTELQFDYETVLLRCTETFDDEDL